MPVFLTVTVKVSVSPGAPLFSGGDIETSTLLMVTAVAMQVALSLTVLSVFDVAVTVILSSMPLAVPSGIMTLRVAVPLSPAKIPSGVGETVGSQLGSALSLASML
ncbi:hypothetical protein ES703_71716 [subsurface metagenome]